MEVVSAREFRANQGAILANAKRGVSVLLTSRLGTFKIEPVTEADSSTSRIADGLREVGKIKAGDLPKMSVEELLDDKADYSTVDVSALAEIVKSLG